MVHFHSHLRVTPEYCRHTSRLYCGPVRAFFFLEARRVYLTLVVSALNERLESRLSNDSDTPQVLFHNLENALSTIVTSMFWTRKPQLRDSSLAALMHKQTFQSLPQF